MWTVRTSAVANVYQRYMIKYRKVALVKLTPEYAAARRIPRMISRRARGVEDLMVIGSYRKGLTLASAYYQALASARKTARGLNASLGIDPDDADSLTLEHLTDEERQVLPTNNQRKTKK